MAGNLALIAVWVLSRLKPVIAGVAPSSILTFKLPDPLKAKGSLALIAVWVLSRLKPVILPAVILASTSNLPELSHFTTIALLPSEAKIACLVKLSACAGVSSIGPLEAVFDILSLPESSSSNMRTPPPPFFSPYTATCFDSVNSDWLPLVKSVATFKTPSPSTLNGTPSGAELSLLSTPIITLL